MWKRLLPSAMQPNGNLWNVVIAVELYYYDYGFNSPLARDFLANSQASTLRLLLLDRSCWTCLALHSCTLLLIRLNQSRMPSCRLRRTLPSLQCVRAIVKYPFFVRRQTSSTSLSLNWNPDEILLSSVHHYYAHINNNNTPAISRRPFPIFESFLSWSTGDSHQWEWRIVPSTWRRIYPSVAIKDLF